MSWLLFVPLVVLWFFVVYYATIGFLFMRDARRGHWRYTP